MQHFPPFADDLNLPTIQLVTDNPRNTYAFTGPVPLRKIRDIFATNLCWVSVPLGYLFVL